MKTSSNVDWSNLEKRAAAQMDWPPVVLHMDGRVTCQPTKFAGTITGRFTKSEPEPQELK